VKGEEYLKKPKVKQLLKVLKEGIRPKWVRPDSEAQRKYPLWAKRVAQM